MKIFCYMKMNTYTTIDEYIAQYPEDIRVHLSAMRDLIKKAAPGAQEGIKYGIPTFIYHGNLVHFGGYKTHIGFYPGPSGIKEFSKELSVYELSKGTVRLPLNKPLPRGLITKIVKFRIKENTLKKK